jgi:predicted RNA binding protein YcfA (HicA-like mRNA interferase family)
MPRMLPVNARELVRFLTSYVFVEDRQSGTPPTH